MNRETHVRAKELISRRSIEPLSGADEQWLVGHLADCGSCAAEDARLSEALRAFRAIHLDLPPNLASRTQFRVRFRAEELRGREPAQKLVWAIAGISWALGVMTAPWVWHGIEWVGQTTGAPKLLLQAGFALWWTVPPLIAAWAALSNRRAAPQE